MPGDELLYRSTTLRVSIEPTNWLTKRIVGVLARVTPRCHDMTRLISQSQDSPLPLGTRMKMRLHYWICAWCKRYCDQIHFVRKALHICPEEPVPPSGPALRVEAKERLRQALRRLS